MEEYLALLNGAIDALDKLAEKLTEYVKVSNRDELPIEIRGKVEAFISELHTETLRLDVEGEPNGEY